MNVSGKEGVPLISAIDKIKFSDSKEGKEVKSAKLEDRTRKWSWRGSRTRFCLLPSSQQRKWIRKEKLIMNDKCGEESHEDHFHKLKNEYG